MIETRLLAGMRLARQALLLSVGGPGTEGKLNSQTKADTLKHDDSSSNLRFATASELCSTPGRRLVSVSSFLALACV